MKTKTIDLAKAKTAKPAIVRVASQFPTTVPTINQNHDGSDIENLVTKQKARDKAKSKQSLINDILKGTFQPSYSKKDPKDLSAALQQVKAKIDDRPTVFRKVKQADTLLIYCMNDGHLIESITLNRRGYYAIYADQWFKRSESLTAIADQYTAKYEKAVFCKKITISNHHYKQYVICENIVDTITDAIDGITVYKQFTILASGVTLTDENNDPITLDSLDTAKDFLKSL